MSLKTKLFSLSIPEAEVADLKSRLAAASWPEADPAGDWSRGVPLNHLKSLAAYWPDGFDWR
jgi:hypothetical protein